MAKFYGTIKGNRGMATRGGSTNSGLKVSAQSYDGSVITNMRYEDATLKIRIDLADDSRSSWGDAYFSGTLEQLKECFTNYKQLEEARRLQDEEYQRNSAMATGDC